MKLLGICAGRKMGNSEIDLKEALMGAEELGGIDIEIIRLHDFNIKPCTGCNACNQNRKKPKYEACPLKDDVAFLWGKIMESDGLIISVPIYILTPPGIFKNFCDRMLHDVGFVKAIQDSLGIPPHDERSFKPRPAGFIAVGGAPLPNWVSLGLPLMYSFSFPRKINVVDQLQVLGAGTPGQVLLDGDAMKRTRELGRHVGSAMGKLAGEMKWMGDEEGVCPVCHCNLMVVGKESPVECAICGIKGDMTMEGNKIKVVFSEEEKKKSRLTMQGSIMHLQEIREVLGRWEQNKGKITKEILDKYNSYKSFTKPAPKQG